MHTYSFCYMWRETTRCYKTPAFFAAKQSTTGIHQRAGVWY